MTEVYLGRPPTYIEAWMKENSKPKGEIGRGYWMVRRLPDGEWRKLVPDDVTGSLWRDSSSNSYITKTWEVSIDDLSVTYSIPADSYEKFSYENAEGYYVYE